MRSPSLSSRRCGCIDRALWLRERNVLIEHSPARKLRLCDQFVRQSQLRNAICASSSVAVTTSLSMNHCTDPSDPVALSPKSKKMESSVLSPATCNRLTVAE